jgi:hypothetical protein
MRLKLKAFNTLTAQNLAAHVAQVAPSWAIDEGKRAGLRCVSYTKAS